ncbi:RNA chaperone ProQ [Bisgaard Taxon 10/6]|uniref:RNA chaperone ProQ n=1 Tax=Exercitatus varius TaxID=67857 RepID=UPI00294B275C|nr:RNA chaperone ProQ [Exercitatus varius]MDG2956910.1 RNA chaperone ProQ [Exercitatus varius]MDG2965043.1 RNA chaperone ProQ [Exercitatus varius]
MTDVQLSEQAAEAQNQPEVQKLSGNKEIIAYLAEKFPLCFSVEGEAKPLKIGLFQDLAEALQDDERISKTQLRHALRQYTSNWRYLHGCRLGAERVDLQGNPAGVLEQEHADHAAQQLAEAKAKLAEKRAAEKANQKKRQSRKPQTSGNKPTAPKTPRQPKIDLKSIELVMLQVGQQVKIKAGNAVQSATVLEVAKDSARVQLENGLIINVSSDRLFA